MKIIVGVKRVVDPNIRITVRSDGSGVEVANLKMALNPFDEIAVEAAVRLKEAGVATEIVVVSIGPAQSQDVIRTALAMGADRGVLIKTDAQLEPLAVAKLLKAVVVEQQADLAILGKQAVDDDCCQTGQMLAALLEWPQATFASAISVADGRAEVVREIDGGLQTVSVALPAVITTDLRLATPRYANLPNIMKARSKPLETRDAASLGVDVAPRLARLGTENPPARKAGIRFSSVDELFGKLREAGVL